MSKSMKFFSGNQKITILRQEHDEKSQDITLLNKEMRSRHDQRKALICVDKSQQMQFL